MGAESIIDSAPHFFQVHVRGKVEQNWVLIIRRGVGRRHTGIVDALLALGEGKSHDYQCLKNSRLFVAIYYVNVEINFYFCNVIYLKEHPEDLNITLALNQVGPQRRDTALRYVREIDRKLSLAAFLLLMEGLEKEYGITEPPVLAFGPHGKPFLGY